MPGSGTLDQPVSVMYKVTTQDPVFGTEVVTWAVLGGEPMWAEWNDILPSRSEGLQGGTIVIARNQARVRLRYRSDIDSSMRVIRHLDGEDVVHDIIGGPSMIGRKEWLEIVCERSSS